MNQKKLGFLTDQLQQKKKSKKKTKNETRRVELPSLCIRSRTRSLFWRIESSSLSLEFSVFLSLQTVYGLCGAVKRHAFEGVPQNLTREV